MIQMRIIYLSYKMAEAIRKENIVDMPDGSDMIAEAMREVNLILLRLSMRSTT